jgi:diguanylate cyclase (GGDEF)-like protein
MLHEEQGYPNEDETVPLRNGRFVLTGRTCIVPDEIMGPTTPSQETRGGVNRCNNRWMVALLAVLLAIAVIAGVWYGTASRRRRIAVEGMVQTAKLLEASSDASGAAPTATPASNPLTDSLTNLGNRQLLERDLAVYGGQVARYGLHVCVALIDIDDFKRFNDRYGHQRGNEILLAVAERITSRSRSGDSIYRLGGDEFLCLLPEQTLETGAKVVERMKRSIEELAIAFEGAPGGIVSVSTGLAILDAEHLKASDELLQEAEAALTASR